MSRWFRVYDDMLDDPKVQRLDPELFKAEFQRALNGEESPFSKWIVAEYGRLPWLEWSAVRLFIFERDKYTCRYCGATGVKLECDHKIPISKGGTNEKSNLLTACRDCNRKKSNKSLEELGWEVLN